MVAAGLWLAVAAVVQGLSPQGSPPPDPVTFISDPVALAAVEAAGGSLGERMTGARAATNDVLVQTPGFASVVRVIEQDLAEMKTADPRAGVGVRHAHRLFDGRWLRSPAAGFQLVGVVNRIDRKTFAPNTCGEVRFIYRLAYENKTRKVTVASRLPMTVNLVFWQMPEERGGCFAVARRWMAPAGLKGKGEALGRWAISSDGPVRFAALGRSALKSLEINLQSVRWPSTVRPDMAGHAEYLLRVFHPGAGAELQPAPLENSPDVARILKDDGLQRELAHWLMDRNNLAAIDQGTALLPEKFLARRAISVAPRGLARLANRPFQQLLADRALAKLRMDGMDAMRTRRLDGMTCAGCHQSRSIAGFHFIGADRDPSRDIDVVAVAMSAHLHDEIGRRAHVLMNLAAGEPADEQRPVPERGPSGGYGAHCGLTKAFSSWTCEPGLRCAAVDEAEVGLCLPEKAEVGDPCEPGRVTAHSDSHRDRVTGGAARACGDEFICERNRVGFPGGMCAGTCGQAGAAAACGSIALLTPFNNCIARKEPFEACLRANVRPAALRRCDFQHPCRDDYVCARINKDEAACIPPYFLFQMRVDGHPE